MAKQNVIFTSIFSPAIPKLPFFINSNVSKLKVEKVLNPPQNPITIRYFKKCEFSIFDEKNEMKSAKTKQLKVLEINVP